MPPWPAPGRRGGCPGGVVGFSFALRFPYTCWLRQVFRFGLGSVMRNGLGPVLFAMFGLGPELVCANFLLSGFRPLTVFPTVFLSPVTTGSGTLQDSLRPYCGLVRLGGDDRWGRRLALLISGRFSGGRGFCSRLRSHQKPPGVFFLIRNRFRGPGPITYHRIPVVALWTHVG